MKFSFGKRAIPGSGALVVFGLDGGKLTQVGDEVDAAMDGQLSRALKAARFKGGAGETVEVVAPQGLKASRVLVVGAGKPGTLDPRGAERLGAGIARRLLTSGESTVSLVLDRQDAGKKDPALSDGDLAALICHGADLASYKFDKYRTTQKADEKPSLSKFAILCDFAPAAKKAFAAYEALGEGVFLARDLMTEPPNVLTPSEFAKRCQELEALGCTVKVLGETQLKKHKMAAMLGVGQGSEQESKLVVMEWKGGTKSAKPLALVGKGVVFDTGGISLKPGAGMEDMKGDMGGAAAVTGAMHAIAKRKAKANVVGLVGLVENMPDGKAQRPGDIVTSMSGQTIEIINTDAEGRLVLCDVLWYCQENCKPAAIVDLATLTGAMVIALGTEYAGFFSNNDDLAAQLTAAGESSGDRLWRMPLGPGYDKKINSKFADMKNVGGRDSGSITAAQFLQRFIKDVPWAHIDIAGTAWGPTGPIYPAWATGFGVRVLDRLVADVYEK